MLRVAKAGAQNQLKWLDTLPEEGNKSGYLFSILFQGSVWAFFTQRLSSRRLIPMAAENRIIWSVRCRIDTFPFSPSARFCTLFAGGLVWIKCHLFSKNYVSVRRCFALFVGAWQRSEWRRFSIIWKQWLCKMFCFCHSLFQRLFYYRLPKRHGLCYAVHSE